MASRLTVGDVDVVTLTGGHFAIATRRRRWRGWWLVRDSGAVCLTMTVEVLNRVPNERREELHEQRDEMWMNERLSLHPRRNFLDLSQQTKARTLLPLFSLMDGGRFLRAAVRFGT